MIIIMFTRGLIKGYSLYFIAPQPIFFLIFMCPPPLRNPKSILELMMNFMSQSEVDSGRALII